MNSWIGLDRNYGVNRRITTTTFARGRRVPQRDEALLVASLG